MSNKQALPDGFYWVKSPSGTWSIAEKMGDEWGVIAFLDNQCEIEGEIAEVGDRIERHSTVAEIDPSCKRDD